jgi:polyisoprenoid-binding protein YceI
MAMRRLATALAFTALALPALAATGTATGIGSPAASTDPATVKAGTYQLDPAHGKITWSVNHLGYSTYIGQFSNVTATLLLNPADLPESKLTASVDIDSVGTFNPALDKMLKSDSFFDAAKYPTAQFVSTRFLRTGKLTANVDGNLTLHGVTHPIVLKITFNQAGNVPMENAYVTGFSGTTTITRSEFGMGAYTNLISDAIPLQIEGEFHLK